MTNRMAILLGAITVAAAFAGCDETSAPAAPSAVDLAHTMGSGTQSTLLGRANFVSQSEETFKVKRITGDWHTEVKAKPSLDLAVQRIVFQPGGQSGWHTHPGPVFIQVVTGVMTFYESGDPECEPIVRSAGQGYLDLGERAHIARNESAAVEENLVIYLAPPGASLRIDADDPGHCPF